MSGILNVHQFVTNAQNQWWTREHPRSVQPMNVQAQRSIEIEQSELGNIEHLRQNDDADHTGSTPPSVPSESATPAPRKTLPSLKASARRKANVPVMPSSRGRVASPGMTVSSRTPRPNPKKQAGPGQGSMF